MSRCDIQQSMTQAQAIQKSPTFSWLAFLASPVAFLLNLELYYSVLPSLCRSHKHWVFTVICLACLCLSIGGGVIALGDWRGAGRESEESETLQMSFVSVISVIMSGFLSLAIIGLLLAGILLNPCQR